MLIQGTNIPIKITFDTSVDSYANLVATLWIQGKEVKRWEKAEDQITIDGTMAILPLDEDETRKFKRGKATLLVKGLNFYGETIFWDEATIEVMSRDDRDIDLVH